MTGSRRNFIGSMNIGPGCLLAGLLSVALVLPAVANGVGPDSESHVKKPVPKPRPPAHVMQPLPKQRPMAEASSRTRPAGKEGSVFIIRQDLRSVIDTFASRRGEKAIITPKVRGRLKNVSLPATHPGFLKELSRRFGIDWYYEGKILHVSASSEATSRYLKLKGVPAQALFRAMRETELDPKRFSMTRTNAGKAILVSAPPSYIARTALILQSLQNGDTVVMIKYGLRKTVKTR